MTSSAIVEECVPLDASVQPVPVPPNPENDVADEVWVASVWAEIEPTTKLSGDER